VVIYRAFIENELSCPALPLLRMFTGTISNRPRRSSPLRTTVVALNGSLRL